MSKRKSKINIIGILFTSILLSCVPAKQFEALQDQYKKCEEEKSSLINSNEVLTVEKTECQSQLDQCRKEMGHLLKDTLQMSQEIALLKEERDGIKKRFEEMELAQQALLKGNAQETRRLLRELQKTQEDLQLREDRLRELEIQMNNRRNELDKLQAAIDLQNQELEKRNARLIELENILAKKDSLVEDLKNTVQNALLGFKDKGLTVHVKNGKVYVSLAEKLLFSSGSAVVDIKGKEALKELSGILEQNEDINILIEGHTDDVPVNPNSSLKDNWGLSVQRAATVVRILLENSTINPRRVTAAGRGEYLPIDPVKTSEARSKNRRTEIILTPKLDELFQILDSN